jgi:stage V sporulation protein B
LADFGRLSGMVFPVLMFPSCILFALAELLIPELARCAASDSQNRIHYLSRRSLKVAMLYGLTFCGLLFLLAEPLCLKLYNSPEAGRYLKLYALLIPMLYCDAITDAMIKGLGQQTTSVRYNIITSILDVLFLYILLPKYGMIGYFLSFLITHLINFLLSIRRLLHITQQKIPLHIPLFSFGTALAAIWAASHLRNPLLIVLAYPILLCCGLYLPGILQREDFRWILELIRKK